MLRNALEAGDWVQEGEAVGKLPSSVGETSRRFNARVDTEYGMRGGPVSLGRSDLARSVILSCSKYTVVDEKTTTIDNGARRRQVPLYTIPIPVFTEHAT